MRHPEAQVTIRRETKRVRARKAMPTERERLWPLATAAFSRYSDYARKTEREIPVVILEPIR